MPQPATYPESAATDLLAALEDALAVRHEAVLTVERRLAAPHMPGQLAQARRRVESLAAAIEARLQHLERVGVRPDGPPLPYGDSERLEP